MEKFYKIIKTEWGFAGVVFNNKTILKFVLPQKDKNEVAKQMEGRNFSGNLRWIREFCGDVKNFFKNRKVDFSRYKLDLSNYTENERKVLNILREIKYGSTISYKELAIKAGIKNGARFVGNVMKKNRFPLIIPCHRVVKSNGKIGKFGYGSLYKTKLLDLETLSSKQKS